MACRETQTHFQGPKGQHSFYMSGYRHNVVPAAHSTTMDQHQAQHRVNQLLTCKAETVTLLRDIGSLLEECIPHSFVWILKNANEEGSAKLVYASQRWSAGLSAKHSQDIRAEDVSALMGKLGRQQELAEVKAHPLADEIKVTFKVPRIRSLVAVPIRPSNSHSWGNICVVLTPHRSRKDSLEDALLWAQFAATIAERRLLEERVQTIETRLDLATKAGGIGIFDWDVTTNSIFWTPQQFEIYGLSPGTFRPSYATWSKQVVPEDLQKIEALLQDTFKDRLRYFENSYRFEHASGETRWIKTLAEVIYDETGKPIRSIGTEQDITDQVHTQEQLTSDRRRLELALEAGELGFWDWNIPTGSVQFGGEWSHMLGYQLSEVEPTITSWENLVHPDDLPAMRVAVQDHLVGKVPLYETEHRLRHKNGSWIWVLDRGRVIERDPTGRAIRAIGIHANITQQREIREKLREADRRKDEFLATLAHELRNPLAPIRTGLAIIKRDPSGAPASQALLIMERQLTHMVRLIDDLLDVSRITRGRLQLRKEDISLRSIVEIAVESSMPAIDGGHHALHVDLPAREIILNCDPTRLAQTISNLLTNSAKYTPDRGTISLAAQVTESAVEIQVSDNGMGIPPEYLEKIFDLFGQVNLSLHRSQGGLGIGLALVRNLVTLHGGTVRASSDGIGKGCTFTISLPLSLVRTPIAEIIASKRDKKTAPHRNILIIDDNIDAANSLAMLAQLLGHTTEVAFSGNDAMRKLPTFKPEVIFLDIGLPDMSGFEVAARIRNLHIEPSPFVVALTGWGSEETKQKAREAGFDDHLTKPVELSRVEDILRDPTHRAPLDGAAASP